MLYELKKNAPICKPEINCSGQTYPDPGHRAGNAWRQNPGPVQVPVPPSSLVRTANHVGGRKLPQTPKTPSTLPSHLTGTCLNKPGHSGYPGYSYYQGYSR